MHDNARRLAKAMADFSSGDHAALGDFFSPDVDWHYAGRSRFAGRYRGLDAVLEFLGDIQQTAATTIAPRSILASDRHAIAFLDVTMERDGRTVSVTEANAMVFDDEGMATGFYQLASDQDALDELLQ